MKTSIRSLPKTRLLCCGLLLFSLFFIHEGCTKIDTVDRSAGTLSDAAATQNFFIVPPATSPVVKAVAAELKKRNERMPFISSLAHTAGYAVWDKAIVKISRHANAPGSFSNNISGEGSDTSVIIPLVPENATYVNAYLVAIAYADSMKIQLYRSEDYDKYGFNPAAADTVMTAEKIALQTMLLDKMVFGDSLFEITDARLFANLAAPTRLPGTRTVKILNPPPANSYTAGASVTVCFTYEYEEPWFDPMQHPAPWARHASGHIR